MPSVAPRWDAFPAALLDFWTERHLCSLTTLDLTTLDLTTLDLTTLAHRPSGSPSMTVPHVVPVGVALDLEQQCAWVIAGGGSRKVRLLRAAGAAGGPVAACQVDGARWSTLEGTGVVVDDAVAVARACERYAARYRTPRENPERVAIRITVSRFLASASLL